MNSRRACLRVWSMVGSGVRDQPLGVALDPEERDPLPAARRHDDQVGDVPVDDEDLVPVEDPAVSARFRPALDAAEVPPAVVLGDGQRPDGLPRRDPGEEVLLGPVVARGQHGVGRQGHGGEERGAQQRRTHLFEDHDQLHIGEARAAELLGDRQRLQAQLVGHLAPHRRVITVGGLHQPPHLGLGRLLGEEPPHGGAELFLLVTEGEIHSRLPLPSCGLSGSRPDARLAVYQNRGLCDQRARL